MVKDWVEGFLSRRYREYLGVFLFFLLLAVIFTWPLVIRAHRSIPGDTGDPCLNSWILSWGARTIFTRPTHLFQANIMYPSRDVLAYSEHLFTLALLAAPVYVVFHNPLLAYNFLFLLGLALSGLGCYLLARELTGSRWASLVGGFFFAFCTYKFSQLTHLQIMFSPFLPFAVLYLYRYLRDGGRCNLFLFGLFLLAQSLSSWHYLVFCFLAVGIMWLWKAAFSRTRVEWVRLGGVVATLAAVLLLVTPFALPYLRAHGRLPGFERNLTEIRVYSARAGDYLTTLGNNLLYGRLLPFFREGGGERVLFPGVIVVVLALLGLLRARRKGKTNGPPGDGFSRSMPLYFLLLAAVSFLLAMGPEVGGAWNALYMIPYRLGMLRFIRVPARFYVLIALALAVLSGYGTARVIDRVGKVGGKIWNFRLWGMILLVLLMAENINLPVSLADVPAGRGVPSVYGWLAQREEARIIELPTLPLGEEHRYDRLLDFLPRDPRAFSLQEGLRVYFSTYHWRRTANGYSGYFPYYYNRIFYEMQGFPSERCLDLLRGLGITHVVWDWDLVPSGREEEYRTRLLSLPGLSLAADFGDRWVLKVETGERSSPQDFRVEAQAPEAVPPGRAFNLGLTVSNPSSHPVIMVEEEPQPFHLVFTDAEGKVVLEERGTFGAPFFLQAGESQALPLRCRRTPSRNGLYTMRLFLEGGVLGTREFTFSVEVREMPDSKDPSLLDGRLEYLGEDGVIRIPAPDGLFPLLFRVTNQGDTYLLAAGEDREEEITRPEGLVHLAMRFEREGPVWEEQRGTLPCDLSPGQSVLLPTLVRPPDIPGRYKLFVGLTDEGFHWFGEVLVLEVEVGDGSD
ncbi:MAG: hypothetical protein QME84_08400 [Actinomycetota bacterium]|nr:hypothetical protein [Actinomycetota bacterium]